MFHELAVTVVDELYADSTSAYRGQDPIERIDAANRRLLLSYRRHATMLTVIDQAAALHPAFRNLRQQLPMPSAPPASVMLGHPGHEGSQRGYRDRALQGPP